MSDKPAIIRAKTGEILTYGELNERSIRVAQFLLRNGVRRGDCIAIFMENHLRYMEIAWAAFRSGLKVVTINRYSTPEDLAYFMGDCRAKALFSSIARGDVARAVLPLIPGCRLRLMVDGVVPGWASHEESISVGSVVPLEAEWLGGTLNYTSGTTGRPKGVIRPLPDLPATEPWAPGLDIIRLYRFTRDMVYLSPAPLYHAAPMRFVRSTQMIGGTVIMMEKFDALEALRLIERYRVTHSQWVPAMFVRMLNLSDAERTSADLSSHRVAVHAAAPCPIDVKRRMIDWWGCIIDEYFGATDCGGSTEISCQEWLAHPGSVGKAPPSLVRICDDEGRELPAGQNGLIYFISEGEPPSYLNDPEKTRAARHSEHEHWVTSGDMGYVGEDGYLYLTDRKAFMIISGGVNIYPQMIEDVLIEHPMVADAAVFGIPHEEMGEEVKAVVELAGGIGASEALAAELMAHCASKLAKYMVPKSVDFIDRMPRTPAGKLLKRVLKEEYWSGRTLVS